MKTFIHPTKERFEQAVSLNYKGPIYYINMLKFKPEGGRESYQRYLEEGAEVFERVGAKIFFRASIAFPVIGEDEWDEIIIVEYPGIPAWLEMIRDEEYQKAMAHRTEALLDSRLFLVKADDIDIR